MMYLKSPHWVTGCLDGHECCTLGKPFQCVRMGVSVSVDLWVYVCLGQMNADIV